MCRLYMFLLMTIWQNDNWLSWESEFSDDLLFDGNKWFLVGYGNGKKLYNHICRFLYVAY